MPRPRPLKGTHGSGDENVPRLCYFIDRRLGSETKGGLVSNKPISFYEPERGNIYFSRVKESAK